MTQVTPEAPDDVWADEQKVKDLLCEYEIDADEIPREEFVFLAALIGQFERRLVTKGDMDELKNGRWDESGSLRRHIGGLKQKEHRKTLNQATEILRSEMEKWRGCQGMGEHLRRWAEAIAVLQMPRGALDNPYDWRRFLLFSRQGSPIKPWTYMAVEIAVWLIPILKKWEMSASLYQGGTVAKFTWEALHRIGVHNLPTHKTLSRRLLKYLGNLPLPPTQPSDT